MKDINKEQMLEQLKAQTYNSEDCLIEHDTLEDLIEIVEDLDNLVKPLCKINDKVFFTRYSGNGRAVDYDYVISVAIIDGQTWVKTGWHTREFVQLNVEVFLNEEDAKHKLSREV